MAIVNRGFRGRRRQSGAGLIPPGQYLVDDFPVLAAGLTPHVSSADPLLSQCLQRKGANRDICQTDDLDPPRQARHRRRRAVPDALTSVSTAPRRAPRAPTPTSPRTASPTMRRCITLCVDCADICETTARVVSRTTEFDRKT